MIGFTEAFARSPLIAILRGIRPEECDAIGGALVEAGFAILEIPLNSPRPFASIAALAARFGDRALVGAGTVLTAGAVDQVHAAGGRLIVMPHGDRAVIDAAVRLGMPAVPGVATPTEAFAALAAGVAALKLFPAESLVPNVVKALRAVMPANALLLPVGSITLANIAAYWQAGANGFGLGSALYRPGDDADAIGARAVAFQAGITELRSTGSGQRPAIEEMAP